MKLGIIGLPNAGKTTIFNALTRGDAPTEGSMGGRFEVLTAVVPVQDRRVDVLVPLFNPEKTVYARITYTDVAGLQRGANENASLSGALLNHLAAQDGFVHVVRAFDDAQVAHPDGEVDPFRDLEALDTELLLSDLGVVERRVEKLNDGFRKGIHKDKAAAKAELALFEQLDNALSNEQPLRELALSDAQEKELRGFGLLTLKPVVVVFNMGDEQEPLTLPDERPNTAMIQLRGKLEMDLAQLGAAGDDESVELFMEEYGVSELGLDRLIRLSYDLLGLQSFFTVGEDEVRAWTLPRGADALEAAGSIHSDLAKGFIRAETIHYDQLVADGSLAAARKQGHLRLEGKNYLVQDGDVISVKFNL